MVWATSRLVPCSDQNRDSLRSVLGEHRSENGAAHNALKTKGNSLHRLPDRGKESPITRRDTW